MMKKKVKKIPKYNAGGSVLDTILKNNQLIAPSFNPQNNGVSSATAGTIAAGKTWSNMNNTQRTGAIVDAAGVVLNGIGNIGKPATLSGAIQGGLSGASAGAAIGGPLGAGIGFAAGTLFNSIGNKASTDGYGNYKKSTGITRLLGIGKSDSEIIRQANIEKNSMISQQQTQAIQSDYYNNPNVTLQPTTAAEGGIVPGEHYASRGEVEVAADGTNAVRYGWDNNGKDTYHVYANPDGSSAVGNMVFTEEGVKRPNGEKYSDAAEKIIKGTKEGSKLRQISLRKLANEMEEQKMNKDIKQTKNGIPAHEKGIYYVDGQRAEYRHGRWWWNEGGKKDARGKMYFVPYTGKSTPSETEPIKYTSETSVGILDPAYRQHVRYSSTNDVERRATVNKPSSGKKTTASRVTTSTTPSPEDTVIRRPERVYDYEEPAKAVTTPTDNTKIYGRDGGVRYDYNTPERKVTPVDLGVDVADVGNDNYTGSDWRGNLYRMMVLTQPFWDKATAEPVNYESPVYKYMPTQIDVTSQFRDTDQSYALAKYNFANLYPNTGAGMAAGLQAAANRAKQYADIRQYQTNAQNELIGKNVGIYNNFANEHARIMNEVYNKTAANRAAARNINRQNRAAWLSNWGTILRDGKQFAADSQNKALQTEVLKPLIQSVYENSDTLMPMLAQYTANKNIKKKSPTR